MIIVKNKRIKNIKPVVKTAIVLGVVMSSSWSIYTMAETVKESTLNDELVAKQTRLTQDVNHLFDGDRLEQLTIEETHKKLIVWSNQMSNLQKEMKNLNEKNQRTFQQQADKTIANIQRVEDFVAIRQAYDALFADNVFDASGLNKEASIKKDVTLDKIKDVQKTIEKNPQAETLANETKLVLDFATQQVETKAAVDSWFASHKNKYTQKNYQAFEKLVTAVTPKATQETYKKPLAAFKKSVDKQIQKEKVEAKKKAETPVETQESTFVQQVDNTNTSSSHTPVQQAPAQQAPVQQAPVQQASRTDGFNFKGQHFDLSSFSGIGAVPQWTPYIYQWSDDPSHYLIEKASDAGNTIWSIGVGDQVVINGQTYTVFNMMSNVPNDDNAYAVLKSQGATVTWQTCESANLNSTLTIWFAA